MKPPKALLSSNKHELRKFLARLHKWAEQQGIYIRQGKLGPRLRGFVYCSGYGNYLIMIEQNITLELQKEVLLHEIEHILYDMPESSYTIGLDMQRSKIEQKADSFAFSLLATIR
ncbi:ImmA/IrrE family metallo-endopeptidase [Orenia marismortui]|uniref:IrrE N-terminal-like domain-containing protein n=1 Tax=Orenia marismortui TaxID=46469 RepID=A0A4R8GT02_9FIRM|nr:hypothetical protein [Orenia marismortui]TDX49139.1 hypothetical protein C7959_12033 [Orenia marismortui]